MAALVLLGSQVHAQAPAPAWSPGLSLEDALARSQAAAGSVKSAQLDVQARQSQADSLARLDWPSLNLTGFAGRLSATLNLDTSSVAQTVNPLGQLVGGLVPGLQVPPFPSTVTATRNLDLTAVGLTSVWPIYTGGRLTAVKGLAGGQAAEAEVALEEAREALVVQTAQRYFVVQLARAAREVREAAVAAIEQHRANALKLEAVGMIARVDRLRVEVVLDTARRDLAKARNDQALAEVALARQVRLPMGDAPQVSVLPALNVDLSTSLFVHREGVGKLQSFVDAGMAHHPAWRKLAVKRAQAERMMALAGAEHAPLVLGVGAYNYNRSTDDLVRPNWMVGVMVNVPLFARIDHGKAKEAARLDQERVNATQAQAEVDIPTLIESRWRALDNARLQFLAMDTTMAMVEEQLRLQTAAFRQSQSTALDVTDAQLQWAKVKVERLQHAHEYVSAMLQLLEATGQAHTLSQWVASADIRLN